MTIDPIPTGMFSQHRSARHVLAVASGKGGVGKSTIAVNLALGLQALGHTVGIFDADLYGPNVPLLLGVHRRQAAKGWAGDLWAPVWRPEGAQPYIRPLERFGLKLMSLGLLVPEDRPINPHPEEVGNLAVRTLSDVQWGHLDYLVVDMPPGWGGLHEAVVERVRIDGVVAVTTPQDLAVLDSARSMLLYRQKAVPILGLVENMSYFACPTCGERHDLFARNPERWQALLGDLPLLQHVPLTPAISQAISQEYVKSFAEEGAGPGQIFVALAREVMVALRGSQR